MHHNGPASSCLLSWYWWKERQNQTADAVASVVWCWSDTLFDFFSKCVCPDVFKKSIANCCSPVLRAVFNFFKMRACPRYFWEQGHQTSFGDSKCPGLTSSHGQIRIFLFLNCPVMLFKYQVDYLILFKINCSMFVHRGSRYNELNAGILTILVNILFFKWPSTTRLACVGIKSLRGPGCLWQPCGLGAF